MLVFSVVDVNIRDTTADPTALDVWMIFIRFKELARKYRHFWPHQLLRHKKHCSIVIQRARPPASLVSDCGTREGSVGAVTRQLHGAKRKARLANGNSRNAPFACPCATLHTTDSLVMAVSTTSNWVVI